MHEINLNLKPPTGVVSVVLNLYKMADKNVFERELLILKCGTCGKEFNQIQELSAHICCERRGKKSVCFMYKKKLGEGF